MRFHSLRSEYTLRPLPLSITLWTAIHFWPSHHQTLPRGLAKSLPWDSFTSSLLESQPRSPRSYETPFWAPGHFIPAPHIDESGSLGCHNVNKKGWWNKHPDGLPSYTIFSKHKLPIQTHPKFLPKVVSTFHLNQSIPVFHPKPQTTPQEATLHTSDGLLHSILTELNHFVNPLSYLFLLPRDQRVMLSLSKDSPRGSWSASDPAIRPRMFNHPEGVRTHFTRAMSTSIAFLHNVPVTDIYKGGHRDIWPHICQTLCYHTGYHGRLHSWSYGTVYRCPSHNSKMPPTIVGTASHSPRVEHPQGQHSKKNL